MGKFGMENAHMSQSVLDLADVKSRMLVIRNQPVLLDRDVAELYGVETRVVNQAVKRNPERFPEGYILELTSDECSRSQILTLNGKPLPLLLSPASTPLLKDARGSGPSLISGRGAPLPPESFSLHHPPRARMFFVSAAERSAAAGVLQEMKRQETGGDSETLRPRRR